jgi:hypothetical protein
VDARKELKSGSFLCRYGLIPSLQEMTTIRKSISSSSFTNLSHDLSQPLHPSSCTIGTRFRMLPCKLPKVVTGFWFLHLLLKLLPQHNRRVFLAYLFYSVTSPNIDYSIPICTSIKTVLSLTRSGGKKHEILNSNYQYLQIGFRTKRAVVFKGVNFFLAKRSSSLS